MIQMGVDKQQIINDFDINGVYLPDVKTPKYMLGEKGYYGRTDLQGNITFGDYAFDSYDILIGTYNKELYHRNNILSGKGYTYANDLPRELNYMRVFPEEALGNRYAHIHNGLYPKSSVKYINQANFYWSHIYEKELIKTGMILKNIINSIYKIPRRW